MANKSLIDIEPIPVVHYEVPEKYPSYDRDWGSCETDDERAYRKMDEKWRRRQAERDRAIEIEKIKENIYAQTLANAKKYSEVKKSIGDLAQKIYNIEHREEIERENYIKNYRNAYQIWHEFPGNENKSEKDFVNQLDKNFRKINSKPYYGDKQIKYKVTNYFNRKDHRNFFRGDNEKKFILYRMIHKKTKYDYSTKRYDRDPIFDEWYDIDDYFICTDYNFKNLYVLDSEGNELKPGSDEYECGRKCFNRTISNIIQEKGLPDKQWVLL